MPELPEVETVRRSLLCIEGQTLQQVKVPDGRLRYPVRAGQFTLLRGRVLQKISREGKYLVFHFSAGAAEPGIMVIHLGMTGRLLLNSAENAYTKVEFHFSRDRLVYIDVRRFGFILTGSKAAASLPAGVDALGGNLAQARDRILRSRSPIKNVLLDQKILSGIGNIYASEILFSAGVNPTRKASGLNADELRRILVATRRVLQKAIAAKGSSISDFVYALPGEEKFSTGYYQKQFLVYSREGEKCRRCSATVRKIVQSNRATYFCPNCQKLE
ncbi:MAG: bifunctional DNA-formamidopyrimidine glycosylase/DNA-(apurinic or apyrimidinic site) lyase [Spirochaetota bacterium]